MLGGVKQRGGKSSRDESGREAEESGVDERQREKRDLCARGTLQGQPERICRVGNGCSLMLWLKQKDTVCAAQERGLMRCQAVKS